MATYKDAGVDIEKGDKCSSLAYAAAKATFPGRKGMIGEPVVIEGGFTGALDMGDFYLVQNDDGVGTKITIAEALGKYDTLGYDLLAMVADDAACVGAEVISISNTIDVKNVDENVIGPLTQGLSKACLEQKVVIPGGEIAELSDMVNGHTWNATAVGVVKKNKFITGANVAEGDTLIGLRSNMFRSNGFTLVRHILKEKFGPDWANAPYGDGKSWGEVTLTPSKIYHGFIMDLHGRFEEQPKVDLKAVIHITGGGLPGNLSRVLKGATLDNLIEPHEPMLKLMEMGGVSKEEAYRTWNMGVGMVLVCNEVDKVLEVAEKHDIFAQVIGKVGGSGIEI
jgi:phosphoribosylformylglycinamidine cyclo-ligase